MNDYSKYSFWLETSGDDLTPRPRCRALLISTWSSSVPDTPDFGRPTIDWMAMTHFDPATKIAAARGYTGQGVSTTNLTGRTLAELISGKRPERNQLPVAQRTSPRWEHEPLRWIAVRYLQNAFFRIDEARKQGKSKPVDTAFAKFLEGTDMWSCRG